MKLKKEGVLILALTLLIVLLIIPLSYSAPTRQCNDGIDNDGNGCADYPADSGCSASWDSSESGGLCTCSSLSGTCCSSGQLCSGGSFVANINCTDLCCVGGSCTDPTHLECSGRSCVSVLGAGSNLCSVNADCYSCGDGVCDANESCANCSADCLSAGKVCCNNIAYTGDCCNTSSCGINKICIDYICRTVSYCGDGVCDANESCSNCSDCACSATQCCSAGSANADAKGCVNSGKITTAGNVCCSGATYAGECCNDAECSSPNVCNASIHTCITPYTPTCTSTNCLCDLSLILQSDAVFKVSTSKEYYISLKDLNGNYTGTSTVTNWIENSSSYVNSYLPTNITLGVNENKTMSYSPAQRCGNTTHSIKVKIATFGCNDSAASNNEANKEITIWGLNTSACNTTPANTTTSTTTPETEPEETTAKEVSYNIEVPQKIELTADEKAGAIEKNGAIEKSFILKINVDNPEDVAKEFAVWSYVYLEGVCYSCYEGKTEENNKKTISVDAGTSGTVELENLFSIPQEGNYKVKVKILDVGSTTIQEFDYDIEVAGVSEVGTEESTEGTQDVYETKSKKIKTMAIIFFIALLLGTAAFFGVKNKEDIFEFIGEKRKEFERRRSWKEHIETRRGKGILQRLSKGFLKKKDGGKQS